MPSKQKLQLPDETSTLTAAMELYLADLEAGNDPSHEEYLTKFPELASELKTYLQGLDLVHRLAPQLSHGDGADKISPLATLGDFSDCARDRPRWHGVLCMKLNNFRSAAASH